MHLPYNWRLMGILDIPKKVESIGAKHLAIVKFGRSHLPRIYGDNIHVKGTFSDCFASNIIMQKERCLTCLQLSMGVAKDNFTLSTWSLPFPNINQHQAGKTSSVSQLTHELVCRPSVACALSTEHKQKLVINAEGEMGSSQQARLVRGFSCQRQQENQLL